MSSHGAPQSAAERLLQERDLLASLLELGHHEQPEPLLDEALALIVRLSGAAHGHIELHDGKLTPLGFSATRGSPETATVRELISSTVIRTSLERGEVIEANVAADPRFSAAASVRRQRIDAVVCVPIGSPPLGVLYLQGASGGARFDARVVDWCRLFARHLAPLVARLIRRSRPQHEDPTAAPRLKLGGAVQFIGRSPALAEVLRVAAMVAPRDIGLLISGPTGSGKTALARLIVENSARRHEPFVELNCANLPTELVESELFGAAQGSHSTATRKIPGKVLAAERGTLFLDEVAELGGNSQAKLLQLLQDGTYFPLGENRARKANVRIIAATHADLRQRVKEGRFREDLFYRLAVFDIAMPPLEHRRGDIAALAERALQDAVSRYALPPTQLSDRALQALESADWPGQVRELHNTIHASALRALACEVTVIEPEHLFGKPAAERGTTLHDLMREHQRLVVERALNIEDRDVTAAAHRLGLGRSTLYQLLNDLGIAKP